MKYEEIILDKFTVVGISVRTTNQNHQSQGDIAKLWETFIRNGYIQQSLPNKISNDIYCIYTDYESDYTGEYTTLIGYKVSTLEGIPSNLSLAIKEFPQAKYNKYISEGELPYVVGKTWAHIWKSDIDRAYKADFDVYGEDAKDPSNAKIATYLSIK
ncbi:AraC family transcriptional regulator [Dysgonomonas sp. Marseille-P4677]|uniref:GyrI-like domain-containing protein n=1 Tax=Dysgonomonas sp. Marseille-P4677 TaxID=2364790 RepID=UPI0019133AD0|nr:GyrI-like domain-containing protein [Dysgonomonas sp. Marseille-P4677]MBK5722876.1 AraC family transcriptional regulator [Dysgonomonas sp. Marseille-P4677]